MPGWGCGVARHCRSAEVAGGPLAGLTAVCLLLPRSRPHGATAAAAELWAGGSPSVLRAKCRHVTAPRTARLFSRGGTKPLPLTFFSVHLGVRKTDAPSTPLAFVCPWMGAGAGAADLATFPGVLGPLEPEGAGRARTAEGGQIFVLQCYSSLVKSGRRPCAVRLGSICPVSRRKHLPERIPGADNSAATAAPKSTEWRPRHGFPPTRSPCRSETWSGGSGRPLRLPSG